MLQHQLSRICYLGIIGVLAAWGVFPTASLAQITPDASLGGAGSQVTPGATIGGQPANLIEGGAQRGANLFHSFSDFNVGNLQRVYFANPAGVQNILSRVTSTNPSNILGTLGVNGAANLFLLNPNGIIFGPNARLDLRGSFVASTADSLKFDNGFAFSARNPQAPPLLTINVPIGLQSGGNPGKLQVQGSTLRVNPGQTLALVGGDVTVNGGQLFAPGGRVELAGVASEGSLDLIANGASLGLRVPASVPRTDVSITGRADVNVRAGGGGSIAINARNVNISGATRVRAGIDSRLGTVGSQAGDIEINATQATNITDASLFSSAVLPEATGNAGNITITTGSLVVAEGTQLSTNTAGEGNAGNVIINARDTVVFDGVGPTGLPSVALSSVTRVPIGNGNAGNVNITTGSLAVTGGAQLVASTGGKGNAGNVIINARDTVVFDGVGRTGGSSAAASSAEQTGDIGDGGDITITTGSLAVTRGAQLIAATRKQGKAGNVIINARDTVVFDGVGSDGASSAAFSSVEEKAIGDGGDINITTESLAVRNGAFLNARTRGQGNGGDIAVNANTLEVNGGRLLTTSLGIGEAGDITLNVTKSVTLSGTLAGRGSSNVSSASGLFANASNTSTNRGGDLTINTGQLTVRDGAQVSVTSAGSGDAGTLRVEADAIRLDHQGKISADTTRGGGNINLRSPLLLLRRNSSITTNATGTATGGNITIAADFIVSAPNENNDIIANAFAGSGGKITLSAQNLFWFDLRTREDLQRLLNTTNPAELDPRRLPTNDITAFSQANPTIDTGAVTVQTLDLDPTRGLTALPTDFTDRNQLIAATCAADEGSSFIITGRGGLPEDPRQPLMGGVIWRDDRGTGETGGIIPSNSAGAIVEAQGLMVDRSGTVVLVAGQPRSLSQSWYPTCASQQK